MTNETLQFEVLKNVTREFFVVPEDGTPLYLKFESPFAVDASIETRTRRSKNDPEGDKKKEPMKVADVVNLQNGEVGRLIGSSVIISEMEKSYPDSTYVNKDFQYIQGQKKKGAGGNTYLTLKIVEIKLKNQPGSDAAKTANKK